MSNDFLAEIKKDEPQYDTVSLTLPDLTIIEWLQAGRSLVAMKNSINWWLGDWLVYGENKFGDEIYNYLNHDLAYKTILTIKKVCRAFPPDKRKGELSFSHHAVIAYIKDDEERFKYLDVAIEEKLSKDMLLHRVREDMHKVLGGNKYKRLCFVSAPYSDNPERGVELSILAGKFLKSRFVPISPILLFKDLFDNGNEYDEVIAFCKIVIRKVEYVCFVKDIYLSNGQRIELNYAKLLNKQIIFIDAEEFSENKQL